MSVVWKLLVSFVGVIGVAVALLMVGNASSLAVDIPPAVKDSAAGRPLSRLSRAGLNTFLDINAWSGSRSGFIALFARDGQVVHATTAGYADLENALPMRLDTRVRLASMTKPVTAVAAHILIEEGRLGLDDPVSDYIPEAANLRVARGESFGADGHIATEALTVPLTIRHLLQFTSGIGTGGDSDLGTLWREKGLYQEAGSLQQRVQRMMSLPLYEQPATRWRYGGSADVMARVVEVAAAQPFDHFLKRRIFDPLGMAATEYLPGPAEQAGLARVYTQDEDRQLVLAPRRIDEELDWTPGGSGLVSTAGDYMRFALMLWNRGSYNGVQILQPETVALMTRAHVADGVLVDEGIDGLGWGLGLAVVVDAAATPMSDRDGDFWWSGYFGTTFFVSPETGLVAVVLSQNEPGPYSGLPLGVYLAQSFAFFGL